MPTVKFSVDTKANIKRIELDEHTHFTPLDLDNGVWKATLDAGYSGRAILYLQGPIGTTAKFKIVEDIGGVDVVLEERNFIRITSPSEKATATVAFLVR